MSHQKKRVLFCLVITAQLLNADTTFYLNTLTNNSDTAIQIWHLDINNRKNPHDQLLATIQPGRQLAEPFAIATDRNGAEIFNHPASSSNRHSNILIQTIDGKQKFNLLVHRAVKRASPSKIPRPQLIAVDINLFENSLHKHPFDATFEKVFTENGNETFFIGLTFVTDQEGSIRPSSEKIDVDLHQK